MKNINKWFWLGMLADVLAAPNTTIIKYIVKDVDPIYFNLIRYSIILIIALPALYSFFKSTKLNSASFRYAALSGLMVTMAVLSFSYALTMIDASYATIITLAGPMFLIPLSIKLEKEKINKKSLVGLSLAAAGAFGVVAMPIAFSQQGSFSFNSLAILLIIINMSCWSLFVIFYRKANEAGARLDQIMGVNALASVIVYGILFLLQPAQQKLDLTLNWNQIIAILYSSIFAIFLARQIKIKVYEKLGSVMDSALGYMGGLLSVLASVIFLGEKLSVWVVAGGIIIILGVRITEFHTNKKHKRHIFHGFRHH